MSMIVADDDDDDDDYEDDHYKVYSNWSYITGMAHI